MKTGIETLRSQVRCPPLCTHSLVMEYDKHHALVVKHWIALTSPTGETAIQWISVRETNYAIQWIESYSVDSTIHLFNNWDQGWSLLEAEVSSLPENCSFFAQQESDWLKCLLLPGAYSFYLHLRRLERLTICGC